jgi:hypothetical protein
LKAMIMTFTQSYHYTTSNIRALNTAHRTAIAEMEFPPGNTTRSNKLFSSNRQTQILHVMSIFHYLACDDCFRASSCTASVEDKLDVLIVEG